MTPWKILLADDEYWVRENLRSMLTELGGFEILDPAVDGEEALARVETERPDLLITDIDMPFLSGNDLIRAARSRHPGLQTVVISGYDRFDYVHDALVDGAVDYLRKPVTPEALRQAVETAVARLEGNRPMEIQQARSLLQDQELSALLVEGREKPGPQAGADLEFEVFTLLLVRLASPAKEPAAVKALVIRESSGPAKTRVFHNLRMTKEFLVLTDRGPEDVRRLATRLAEQLARYLGCHLDVGISAAFSSLTTLSKAYREARTALLIREARDPGPVLHYDDVHRRAIVARISGELERLVGFAVEAQDRNQVRDLVFTKIGLRSQSADWLLAEVRQTAGDVVALLLRYAPVRTASIGLALEDFYGTLDQSLQDRNLEEVCSLTDQWIDRILGPWPGKARPSIRDLVRRVEDYIDQRFQQNLSPALLSQVFRVDASYLSKAFRQVTGSTVSGVLASKRIHRAMDYIRERRLSLIDVAALVGYDDYAYFNRVFHKVTGISPTEYKDQWKKSDSGEAKP